MNIQCIDIKNNNATIQFSGVPLYMVNALRRTIFTSVNTYAIDTVEFISNKTLVDSGVLAHKIGLYPIVSNGVTSGEIHKINNTDECFYITTDDVKGIDFAESQRGAPICELYPGQELHCLVETRKGCGKEHMKWCPVSVCTIRENGKMIELIFEMTGSLSAEKILDRAIQELVQKFEELKKNLNDLSYA
jgi:DNA-directed RNA polymerase subunit D